MTIEKTSRVLIFGSTGVIGGAIAKRYRGASWAVTGVAREARSSPDVVIWDPLKFNDVGITSLRHSAPFNSVCWAQGINFNDNIRTFDRDRHAGMYEANVLYVVLSLQQLLDADLLANGAKLCIVSSIWQEQARQNKLSYTLTKASLRGLVLSLAADLGSRGYFVNAVLPGVIDTPMTRQNLAAEQITQIARASPLGRLPSLEDVASAVYALASEQNTGVTGQFLAVDAGFTNVRTI